MFLLKVTFIVVTFLLMVGMRARITRMLHSETRRPILNAILPLIPLIIIEEVINSNPHGLAISLVIMAILFVQALLLLAVVRALHYRRLLLPLVCYSILGTAWELTFGGLKGIWDYPPPFAAFMVFAYVPISYAYFSLIPLSVYIYGQDTTEPKQTEADSHKESTAE